MRVQSISAVKSTPSHKPAVLQSMGFSSETARDRQREVWREVKKEALTWRDVCRERQRNRGERERVSGAIKRER